MGDSSDIVDLRDGDAGDLRRKAGADAVIKRIGLFCLFIGQRKEQRIADDRAREMRAILLRIKVEVDRRTTDIRSGQAVVGITVESRAAEVIAPRTQHDVNCSTLKIAFGYVIRRNLDGELLNRINRHRATVGRQSAVVEAEIVAELYTIYREAIEAAVITSDFDSATVGKINGDQWVAAGKVTDIAVDGGDAFDVLAVKRGDRTGRLLDSTLQPGCSDDDFPLILQHNRKAKALTGAKRQIGDLCAFKPVRLDRHRERSANAKAVGTEVAIGVGSAGRSRTRRFVNDCNGCAGNRPVGAFNGTANRSRSFLRHCWRCEHCRDGESRSTRSEIVTDLHL